MFTKHGKSNSREYRIWANMIQRCENTKHVKFCNYGGRGIVVCDRWKLFQNFFEDVGEAPSKDHSIERDDNNGNYEPVNVRWATRSEQGRNKRNNRLVEILGTVRSLVEWCEISGLKDSTLEWRLDAGWSENKLLQPARPKICATA